MAPTATEGQQIHLLAFSRSRRCNFWTLRAPVDVLVSERYVRAFPGGMLLEEFESFVRHFDVAYDV
jgi:hypothetical protein